MAPGDRSKRLSVSRRLAALVVILVLLGMVIAVTQRGKDVASLAGLGYPGVALLMFLSSGTILFPAPGFAAVLAAGTLWNPLLVGIAAGVGAATGELSGYVVGVGSKTVLDLKEARQWQTAHRWLERHGLLAILVLALVPNPLFDAIGLVAGSLSYPIRSFWLACAVGNCVKYAALAYLANSIVAWSVTW